MATVQQTAAPARLPRFMYREALVSYLRNRAFSLGALGVAGGGALLTWSGPFSINWVVWGWIAWAFGALAGLHVTGRLSDYRASLLPGYRQAQLAALIVFLLIVAGALLLWSWARFDGTEAGTAGVIVLGLALGCWSARAIWCLFVVPLALPMALVSRSNALWLFASTAWVQAPLGNGLLLAAGVGLVALFADWLWRLTEEEAPLLPPFFRAGRLEWVPTKLDTRQKQVLLAGEKPGARLTEWFCRRQDRRIDAALARGSSMVGWNVRRWLVPFPQWAAFATVMIFGVLLFGGWLNSVSPMRTVTDPVVRARQATMPLSTLILMFAVNSAILVKMRRPFLATESLRPVTRRRFVHEMGLGLVYVWLVMVPMAVAAVWLCDPDHWRRPTIEGYSNGELAALFAALALAVFAAVVWSARFRSIWAVAIVGGLVGGGSQPVWDVWSSGSGTWWPMATAAGLAIAGLGLLWDARRRWLLADLE